MKYKIITLSTKFWFSPGSANLALYFCYESNNNLSRTSIYSYFSTSNISIAVTDCMSVDNTDDQKIFLCAC